MTPARTAPETYEPTIATTRWIERHRLLSDAGVTRCAAAAAGNGAGAFDRGPHQGLRNMKSLVTDYFTIAPGTATERFWELLFPLPFRRDLMRQSSASDLDPHMVAGLVRQESEFNPS